jgi:cytochrome c-type biogenesis protein CcmH
MQCDVFCLSKRSLPMIVVASIASMAAESNKSDTFEPALAEPEKMISRLQRRVHGALVAMLSSLMVLAAPGLAVTPGEMLKDPMLEGRARAISQQLRCVVCQNQSIDDSNAPLAHDLRILVRERLTAQDTDQQVISFIVARYGNFVLLRPPMQINTLALWFAPMLLLAIAGIGVGRYLKKQAASSAALGGDSFTSREQNRIDEILNAGSSQ